MIDAGYFVKRSRGADGFTVPGERDMCSASNCLFDQPDGWVDKWLHNWFGWFNSADDAWSVVPVAERASYRLFAYRLHQTFFRKGHAMEVRWPADVRPVAIPPTFRSLGFDAVSKSMDTILSFECSPLSCNGLHLEHHVNSHCLFPTLEAALCGGRAFSLEEPEPGDYYVVEVLEDQHP